MKRLFNFIAIVLLIAIFALPAFAEEVAAETAAEEVPSIGLTDSDVVNFCRNYEKVNKAFEECNKSLETRNENDYTGGMEDLTELDSRLEKLGISGPGATAKVYYILYAYSIEKGKQAYKSNTGAKLFMKMAGADGALSELSSSFNQDDYACITGNYRLLQNTLEPKAKPAVAEESTPKVKSTSTKKSLAKDVEEEEEEDFKSWLKKEVKKEAKNDAKAAIKKGIKNLIRP